MVPVHLDSVTKQFETGVGVHSVSTSIEPGEFFTLLGPSGCGKTTTLRMIAGFNFPTSGRILFGDTDVTFLPPHKRGTGMVFQNYALFPHMTVFENVAFGLKVRRVPSTDIRARVERALQQVRLEGLGGRKIGQLSGGQQQRVALARAIVIEPKILLLDEPLSNLDAKLREETRVQIRELQMSLGLTTIYVTHDQGEAMMVSDRIMVMNAGEIQQIAKPQDLYTRPANRFVATFVGETNLLRASIESFDAVSVALRVGTQFTLMASRDFANTGVEFRQGGTVHISIRPEAVQMNVNKDSATNVTQGTVRSVDFGGIYTIYTVQAGEVTLRVASNSVLAGVLAVGDEVSLYISTQSVYVVE